LRRNGKYASVPVVRYSGIVGALGLGLTVSAPVALSCPLGLLARGSLDVLLPAVDFGLERPPLLPSGYQLSLCRGRLMRPESPLLGRPGVLQPGPRGKDQLLLFRDGTGNTSFALSKWGVLLLPPVASPW
jgi:hypothetical protein